MHLCLLALVCVSDWAHVCYHDASPQLSHSFPAASRGWKQAKPQTSGAPQPIRIVYLASHGRRAEQEHVASHTALHWNLSSLSFSTPLNSFGSPSSLASLLPPTSSFLFFFPLQSDRTFPGCFRSPRLIITNNKLEMLWFVFSAVSLFV